MIYRNTSDGKRISLLGYGAMRIPGVGGESVMRGNDTIDQRRLNTQVRRMLDGGITYFDTSPAYCKGRSESALGEALQASGYSRGDYVIATKLSNFAPAQYPLAECKAMFERSLKCLRTDYIDNYLLHSIGKGGIETFRKRYLDNGALEWCCEQRAARRIRNLGFSFHGDPKAFDWCLEHHDRYHWDFCMIQMNYVDWRHAKATNERNINASELYRRLTELKIPVAIMEPLLGGRLARYNWALAKELVPLDPDSTLAKWAFRFCGSFDNVMTVISGMTFEENIEENIATFSPLRMLKQADFAALERAAEAMLSLKTIPCTSCNYCMPCPYGLDIPSILLFRNQVTASPKLMSPRETLALYEKMIPEPLRRADHCTGCGRCVGHCPQQIDIPAEIAAIDAWIDEVKDGLL